MLLHVRFVAEPGDGPATAPLHLVRDAWSDPVGIAAAAAVLVGLGVFLWVTTRWRAWDRFRAQLAAALRTDHVMVPWVLRLSVGISALAAGLSGTWLLAHLPIPVRGPLAMLLIAAGFAVLVGLAVRVAAGVVALVWIAGIPFHGAELVMAAEVAAAAAVLVAGAAGRPSLDAYLARALPDAPRPWDGLARLRWLLGPSDHPVPVWGARALQVGLGASFAATGVLEKFLAPGPAIATATHYGLDVGPVSPEVAVVTASLVEVLLGVLLMLGIAPRPVSGLAFVILTVTLFALPDDPVTAHVSLWGVASAVFLLGRPRMDVEDPALHTASG